MSSSANTSAYVDSLYRSKFGRAPDAGGKAYWTKQINSGKMSPEKVAQSFDQSKEAKDRAARGIAVGVKDTASFQKAKAANAAKKTAENKKTSLAAIASHKRASTPSVTITPTGNSSSPRPSNVQSKATVTASPQASPAPQNLSYSPPATPTNAQKIEQLYTSILERPSDASGKQYWLNALNSGTSIEKIAESIRQSKEFDDLADKKVEALYNNDLGRTSDASGKEYWKNHLKKGDSIEEVSRMIDATDEGWLANVYEDVLGRPIEGLDPNDPNNTGIGAGWDNKFNEGRGTTGGREWWLADLKEGKTRQEILDWIKNSPEAKCYNQTGVAQNVNYSTGECGATPAPCGANQTRNAAGQCVDNPPDCGDGYTAVNGTCVPDRVDCPDGMVRQGASCVTPDPDTPTCSAGYSLNAAGTACIKDEDPVNPGNGSGNNNTGEGEWMGPEGTDPSGAYSDENPTQSYDNKKKEYEELFQLEQEDRDRLNKGDSSYTGGEVGSYVGATSHLTTGRTVGGGQASIRPSNLKSGGASWSDQTDDAGMVTAGPGASSERPYAKAGLKRGANKRSSFYYDKKYF